MLSTIYKKRPARKLLLWACLTNGAVYAQDAVAYNTASVMAWTTQTPAAKALTLGSLLNDLEKQHNISFVCKSELLKMSIRYSTDELKKENFYAPLKKLLQPYGLAVKQITPKQYAISNQEKEASVPEHEPKQNMTIFRTTPFSNPVEVNGFSGKLNGSNWMQEIITGTVTAKSTGMPVPNVTVSVKGCNQTAITNDDGKFAITTANRNVTLVFSSAGFVTAEAKISDATNTVNMILVEYVKEMEQVVVVGYGTQKKRAVTGAVEQLSGKEMESRPITATSSGLQGMIPGLTIVNQNPRPGIAGNSVRIRGIGTLGNANAFILVDGVEQNMDLINPDDIESVSVLKDAAAAAIYGTRGANGVILITTKKGRRDSKPNIAYSYYYGFQKPTRTAEFLGSPEYMELLNEAQLNTDRTPTFTQEEIDKARNGSDPNYFANTNWVKEIYKSQAPQQNHNVSVNGGNAKSGYYLSYGYFNQAGLITGDAFGTRRHNVRLRVNTEIADRLSIDGNIGFIDRYYSEPQQATDQDGGVIYSAHQISPLVPVRFTNGNWGYGGGSQNPIAIASEGGQNQFASQELSANLSATLQLIKGLSAKIQYGTVMYNSRRNIQTYTIEYTYPEDNSLWYTSNPVNKIDVRTYMNRYQVATAQLDYIKTFGKHEFKLLAGGSQEVNRYDDLGGNRQGLITQNNPTLALGSENQQNSGTSTHWALRSLFGRFNYAFNEKYLLEFNTRYDGSSRFAKEQRFEVFPSLSAGWRFSEEAFMSGIRHIISEGKLRASYGTLGNQYVGSSLTPYLATIGSVGTMPIGAVLTPAYAQTEANNPDLKWETVKMSNIGIDLAMLNSKLNVSLDYFDKNTEDILEIIRLPDVLGVSEPYQNSASVNNRGWELGLNWNDRAGAVKYRLNANVSDVKNKITKYTTIPTSYGDQANIAGYAINSFYGLVAERIAQEADFTKDNAGKYIPNFPVLAADKAYTRPGDLIYKDLDGDGNITLDKDRQVIGHAFPRYTYSLRGNADWNGIDFGFFLQGVGKGNGYILGPGRHAFINQSTNPQKLHLDRWTPENTDASYPRLTSQQSHNQRFSTYWLENAAYIRLKNIQVGYTLPAGLTERIRLQRLRVYVSGDNLFTKTDFFYAYDPETAVSNGGYYPQLKTLIVGININFR